MTLKYHLDDPKQLKGQLFTLYTFDPVRFILIAAAVPGCSKEKFENFPQASLVLRLTTFYFMKVVH